ncbi:MAG: hypothetical protein Q8N42_02145 [bacterium]|nr:hypothetical protein [bacterium]
MAFGFYFARGQEETITLPTLHLEDFSVDFSPATPGANTLVSANLTSYTFDVNRSAIAWIINGKIVGSGKNFSFTTGGLGSVTNLKVSVITPKKNTLSKFFSFQAAEVDLLWETSSHVPPPYQGKALPPPQASIKVTAIPQGIKTSASKLIYEWKLNDKNLPDSSGQRKNTLNFYSSETGGDTIKVSVSDSGGNVNATNQIAIGVENPKILFYENQPLEGPQYQKELEESISLGKPELILRAEPFFFSKRALPILSYEWQMNGQKIETPQKPNLLNLTAPSGQKGTSVISLTLENSKNILERANGTIQINFDF